VVSLFDNLTILENRNPTVDIASRHVNEVGQEVTYRSTLAMVYNKRGMSDAVLQTQKYCRFTESRWAIDSDERLRTKVL
jgi:hypothetical protein